MVGLRVRDAVQQAAARLSEAGVASPEVDAHWLVAHVLGVGRGGLAAAAGRGDELTAEQASRVAEFVRRRASREPLQHLLGRAPFRYLDLAVGPGVFVPRPETELLVEWALAFLRSPVIRAKRDCLKIVDLCAGSGAIAAAIAAEAPPAPAGMQVWAVEADPDALPWLRRNVGSGGSDPGNVGSSNVIVIEGDATDPQTLAELDGQVDLVASNPPYVPETLAAELPPEVTEHDPRGAVFAGPDGLSVIRPLIGRAAALLRPGGTFVVEHDESHEHAVPALLVADGRFAEVADHRDLSGRPRFATARRAHTGGGVADFAS